MPITSQLDVQARWAYSEIFHGISAPDYNGGPGIEELRVKRGQGVPFEELDQAERYCLAYWCFRVRPLLVAHMTPWRDFDLIQISREQMKSVFVPPNVWGGRIDQYVRFADYMGIHSNDAADARNVPSDPARYRAPSEPLVFARYNGDLLLMDGYHRAASFWKCAPKNASLAAYAPV
jgi:hypothetical protein